MKIPIDWLKEYVALPKSEKELSDALTMAGHMLDKKTIVDGKAVIDLELRGNRADCYSIYGIAREVSAIFGNNLKVPQTVKLIKGKVGVNLNIKTPLVKRAGMIEIYNVKIMKSPEWLSGKLNAYGMDSINNIVDLTNYVMIELGEPMHAFDLDKVGNNLEIRLAAIGEKLTTFMGEEISLTDDDLVWAKDRQILSVAGAVGEKFNSISDTTKNILLEAANYDRANIRRTVYRHKLLTDAGLRHEKELDPEMVETAIGRFLYLLKKYGWGEYGPVFYDYYPKKVIPKKITLDINHLENLGGTKIEKGKIIGILKKLSFEILSTKSESITVEVPTYRTDVSLPEDVIEEVLRIYGYDKIPDNVLSLPIPENITPEYILQENNFRSSAASAGFNEIISNSFVKENLLKYNVHPDSVGNQIVGVVNPPSPDNEYLRISLFPNLLENAKRSINERDENVRLFEIGKVYMKQQNKYKEERKIAFIYSDKEDSFIKFKQLVLGVLINENLTEVKFISDPVNIPLAESYRIYLGKQNVGYGGRLDKILFLELDLNSLLGKEKKYKIKLWPKYPPQIEDITFALPEKTKVGDIIDIIRAASRKITIAELTDIFNGSYTFHIEYQDPDKTLTDEEVDKIRKEFLKNLKNKFGVTTKG